MVLLTANSCGSDETPDSPIPIIVVPIDDWTVQATQTNADLYDIFFLDASKGWAVGAANAVLSTSNGGESWPQVPTTSVVRDLKSVFFVDEQNGWIAAGSLTNPRDGQILISSMGGAYPTSQYVTNDPMNALFFLDKNTGWSGGEGGSIAHTENGGVTWSDDNIGVNAAIHDLHFSSPQAGWLATDSGIYKTSNGTTWSKEPTTTDVAVQALHFVGTLGWACGPPNAILKMDPQSGQWAKTTITDEPAGQAWRDIFFIDSMKGWVVGNSARVYRTSNGGAVWSLESTGGVTGDLFTIHMVTSTQGWIGGQAGVILRYTPR